jgi:hypothetical protein
MLEVPTVKPPLAGLQILVDRNLDGTASYGSPRDVTGVFPHAPINIEFSYSLDTAKYADGRTF